MLGHFVFFIGFMVSAYILGRQVGYAAGWDDASSLWAEHNKPEPESENKE